MAARGDGVLHNGRYCSRMVTSDFKRAGQEFWRYFTVAFLEPHSEKEWVIEETVGGVESDTSKHNVFKRLEIQCAVGFAILLHDLRDRGGFYLKVMVDEQQEGI